MVRVLSCHHFRGQKVGRCEGGVGVALADEIVIVALEHLINVYSSEYISNIPAWFAKKRAAASFGSGPLGGHFNFDTLASLSSPVKENVQAHQSQKKDAAMESLRLSHSFPPVDLIHSVAYNKRGHYLQCMERRESGAESFRVRIYFHWDRPPSKGRPMKARIAGLVSPTGGDVDSDSLLMIEIPPEPLFATVAATSCQYSANVATLASDGRVNVYTFRVKEGAGRSKLRYADFDLTLTLQLAESSPFLTISFALNYIGTGSRDEAIIFRLKSAEVASSSDRKRDRILSVAKNEKKPEIQPLFFNPKKSAPGQKLLLPTILKENRRRQQPGGFLEEFGDEVRNGKTTITTQQTKTKGNNYNSNLGVEDMLRVRRDPNQQTSSSSALLHLSLQPQRINSVVGGTLCLMATETEMLIYHLPEVEGSVPRRVTKCPFTGPLQHLLSDWSFIHALTESGIETYSSRGLAESLKDTEGFSPLNNDCPLREESPCLLGIRPFPGVRFMEANDHCLCLLSAPAQNFQQSSTQNELWTIYLLESPPADQFYEDGMRGADAHKESSPDVYLTLLGEIHLFLRGLLNRCPEEEPKLRDKYRLTTRLMGLQLFRNWTSDQEANEDLLNRGIAFLQMAHTDSKFFFRRENQDIPKDPQLVTGIAKFLRLTLPLSGGEDFPPSLSKAIVDFLATNSMAELAKVTLEAPWLREAQGQRILTALRTGDENGWRKDLALILVIVSVHGRDVEGIDEIQNLLRHADTENLEKNMKTGWILEQKKNKFRLSDLTIVLSMTRTSIHTNVIVTGLEKGEVKLDEMILAFHQGVNLNADLAVKESLTKDLRRILETFFMGRMNNGIERDEEIRGLHLLISSYLANILQQQPSLPPKWNAMTTESGGRAEPFGRVPSFIHAMVEEGPYFSAIAREHFYALASLLTSPLGNAKGVKDLVLRTISSQPEIHFGLLLRVLAESSEGALILLLDRRPEMILIYAKETFGSSVDGWKLLVAKLKAKVASRPPNQDVISTLTESVYLHLANSLSPSTLEEILEKEGAKDHFLDASKRIDLANTFADRVVQMSFQFLSRP